MQTSDLNTLLKSASQTKSLSEANDLLLKSRSLLKSALPPDSITQSTLSYLKSLSFNFSYQLLLPISKTYKSLFYRVPKSNKPLLISLCKEVKEIITLLHGTTISYVLNQLLHKESRSILLDPSLSSSDHAFFQSILDAHNLEISEVHLNQIISDIKENNPFGITRLMDFFCSLTSIRDQFYYFSNIMQPVIMALDHNLESEDGIDREILLKLLELLEHFIFKYNYNVQLSKYDQSSPMYSQPYTLLEFKLIRLYNQNFEVFVSIINILRSGDILITQNLIRIIHRLWNLCKENRSLLYDLILNNIREVVVGGTEEAKQNAGHLLFEVMNSKETSHEFRTKIDSDKQLSALLSFSENEEIFEQGEEIEIDSLQVVAGFPLSAVIPSGSTWSHVVEVPESRCVLSWGFATEQYDLSFSLTRVDLPEAEVLISHLKVKCDDTPYAGIRLLTSPGLYRFTWSNTHSWFRAKHLRYKIFLLQPYRKTFSSINLDLSKVINVISDDDLGDSVFTEYLDFLEIGVQVKYNLIRFLCLDPNSEENYICEEVQYQEESEIVLAISDFIHDVLKDTENRKFASIKVGLVMDRTRLLPGIEQIGAVAVSRDMFAVGLLSYDSLKSQTIIVVMNEDGLRSCVVHKGKILVDESGENLGNLENFKDMAIDHMIGLILCMFGPAAVILAGEGFDNMDLPSLTGKIKQWVPDKIWAKSFLRESVFKQGTAAQAAAKLFYLNYRFN